MFSIALIALIWWIFSGPPEPVYKGQPLSVWLNLLLSDNAEGAEEIRAMGTNSIPYLLRLLQERESTPKKMFYELAAKQSLFHFKKEEMVLHDYELHNMQAVQAFGALGPMASNAVPQLIKIYARNKNESVLVNVSTCLALIGPSASPAIPALLSRASSTNQNAQTVRLFAITALGAIHSKPEVVVPTLTTILTDPDVQMRVESANALARFGAKAQTAVPLLIKNLDLHPSINTPFFTALQQIDPDAAAKWQQTNSVNSASTPKP
ncbi:MAG TPA: HEAT repeat domain-containing protein [Verrucomicrobiae bacterium]|nr:HEAT repeat domain-containing protein [Verrucomicrobiae bacterium]